MPMTVRELDAIADLRAANLTLKEAFPPERRAGRFIGFLDPEIHGQLHWPVVMGYRFRFRYNRVDGLLSSVGNELDLFSGILMSWRLGQATGFEQTRLCVSLARPLGEQVLFRISRERMLLHRASGPGTARRSLRCKRRSRTGLFRLFPADPVRSRHGGDLAGLHFTAVWNRKKRNRSSGSSPFLAVRTAFRANPPVRDGTFRSVYASLALPRRATRTIRSAALRVEHGSPQRLADGTAFTLLGGHIDLAQSTCHSTARRPRACISACKAVRPSAIFPPQRTALLDTGLELFDGLRLEPAPCFPFSARTAVARGAPRRCLLAPRLHDAPFEWVRLWPLVRLRMGITLSGPTGASGDSLPRLLTKDFPASPGVLRG